MNVSSSDWASIIIATLLLVISIILIVYSTKNRYISPAPKQLTDIYQEFGRTYCIPSTKIDVTQDDRVIRTAINDGYYLMVSAGISGIILLCISVIMFVQIYLMRNKRVSPKMYQK